MWLIWTVLDGGTGWGKGRRKGVRVKLLNIFCECHKHFKKANIIPKLQ